MMPKIARTVYAVVYNLPGCLPDYPDSVMFFERQEAAEEYIAEQDVDYEEYIADHSDVRDPYVWDIIPVRAWRDRDGQYYEEVGAELFLIDVL